MVIRRGWTHFLILLFSAGLLSAGCGPYPPQDTQDDFWGDYGDSNFDAALREILTRKRGKEFWDSTRLSWANLQAAVNDRFCYTNARAFLGCMNVVNLLLASRAQQPQIALPDPAWFKLKTSLSLERQVLHSENGLVFVKLTPADQQDRFLNDEIWMEAYLSPIEPSQRISFDQLLSELIKNSVFSSVPGKGAFLVLNALLSYLDPHTSLEDLASLLAASDGESEEALGGIGMDVEEVEGFLAVQGLTPYAPAARAGIRLGDRILAVNQVSMLGTEWADSWEQLRKFWNQVIGPVGTGVIIKVARTEPDGKSEHRLTFELKREIILASNVDAEWVSVDGTRIGHMTIQSFMLQTTGDEAREALESHREADAWILDLRGNAGGDLEMAKKLSNLFLPKESRFAKLIPGLSPEIQSNPEIARWLQLEEYKPKVEVHDLNDEPVFEKPVVVLINEQSASASEMVAGVFQDLGKGTVVGVQSFGKGMYMKPIQMKNTFPGLVLVLRAGSYELPSGRVPDVDGVCPDVRAYRRLEPMKMELEPFHEGMLVSPVFRSKTKRMECGPTPRTAKLEACMASLKPESSAKGRFRAQKSRYYFPDYQLYTAVDVARCLVRESR